MNDKINAFTERFAKWYVPFANRHRFKLLALMVLVAAACLYPIVTRLRIDADLAKLLPGDTPSVLALEESFTRFGSTDRFMIAIQSEDPQLVADMQDSVRAYIQQNWKDDFVTVQIDNDNSFFKKNALLYIPLNHLERIRDNLEDLQLELGRNNLPLVVNLLDEAPVADSAQKASGAAPAPATEVKPKKERVWFDASIPQELGLPDEAVGAFDAFFDKSSSDTAKSAVKADEWSPKANVPEHLKTRLIGQPRPDSTGKVLFNGLVQAKLIKPSTDYQFVGHILARSDTLIQHFSKKSYGKPVRFTVEGTYEGLKEVEDLQNDSTYSFAISLVLIILLVAWFFRSLKAPFIIIGVVLFSCVLMLAFTAVFYGALNPFTVFVASIILGIGIDYSIHLMGAVQHNLPKSKNLEEAMVTSLSHMVLALSLAALTTVAGLLTLLVAQFRGFYEFGVVASVGVIISTITALLGLPVVIFAAGGLPEAPHKSLLPESWSEGRIYGFFRRLAIYGFILGALLLVFAPFTDFEHNLSNLRRPSREDASAKKSIGTSVAMSNNRKSSSPAAVMGSDPAQLDMLYDTLMVRLHKEKDPTLRSFLTLKSFVPAQSDQEERLEIIEEIRDQVGIRVFDRATGKDSANIAALRDLAEVDKAFTAEDIPTWALDLLREKDGSYGKIGFIYGSYPSWDAHAVHKFQQDYGNWTFKGEKLRVFSSQFILSDVIEAVKVDSVRMAFLVTLVIILTMVVSLRKPAMFVAGTIALLMGIVYTVGFMGLLTLTFDVCKIGIYNVIVIPMVLGVGIDSTIHIIVAWTQRKDLTIRHLLDATGRSILASSTTTAAGFVGMLFTAHRGLRTIGELACLSIMLFLVTSLVFTLYFCRTWLAKDRTYELEKPE
jgi:uncharacterized protein